MEAIDISEWVIKLFSAFAESEVMDIRMCECLIVKILFFLLWIIYGGQERFTGGYFSIYLAIWIFFHFYVLVVEFPYICDGMNDIDIRKQLFKIVDLIQVILLLIYFIVQVFAYHQQNQFYLLTTMSLFVDFGLNIDQIAKVIQKWLKTPKNQVITEEQKKEKLQNNVNGGEGFFYLSIIIGCAGAFVMTLKIYQYIIQQTNQEFPFYPALLILCMIGEWCFIIFILILLFGKEKKHSFFGDTIAKTILVFLYGISLGLFNFYYSIILATYCIYKLEKEIRFSTQKGNERE